MCFPFGKKNGTDEGYNPFRVVFSPVGLSTLLSLLGLSHGAHAGNVDNRRGHYKE